MVQGENPPLISPPDPVVVTPPDTPALPQHPPPLEQDRLETVLPESLPGLQRVDVRGGSDRREGLDTIYAEAVFRGEGKGTLFMRLGDSGRTRRMPKVAGHQVDPDVPEIETDSGFIRAFEMAGFPAVERSVRSMKATMLNVLVRDRMLLEVRAMDIESERLRGMLATVDFSAIAALIEPAQE